MHSEEPTGYKLHMLEKYSNKNMAQKGAKIAKDSAKLGA